MGLLRDHNHFNSHDNSVRVKFPDKIEIHEHKAPTDESIRLMEEMHQKALDNIISHVKVEDNLIKGDVFIIHQPWRINEWEVVCKFKINGIEFNVSKVLDGLRFDNPEETAAISQRVGYDTAKAIMLQYALKVFVADAFEQITQTPLPKEYIKKI